MTKWNEISSESVILAAVKANGKRTPPRAEYTVADGRGLMLVIKEKEKGQRSFTWRFQYKRPTNGKTNNLTLGAYFVGGGGVGIAAAREKAQEAREALAEGRDPAEERNQAREVAQAAAAAEELAKQRKKDGLALLGTFRAEAESWIEYKRGGILDATLDNYSDALELHVYPCIGDMPLSLVRNVNLRPMVEKLEKAGSLSTLDLCLNKTFDIFERAKNNGVVEFNPICRMSVDLKKKRTAKKSHNPAAIEPKKIGAVIAKIRANTKSVHSRDCALLAAYTLQRISSIASMRKADLDLDGGTWSVPPAFMKMRRDLKENEKTLAHIVPLSRQAVAIIRAALARQTRLSPWVFPHRDDASQCAGKDSVSALLRRLGFAGVQTVHGFRVTGRTAGEYFAGLSPLLLEAQLAHKQGGNVQAKAATGNMPGVYLRTDEFLRFEDQIAARREVVQAYADFLDSTEEVPNEGLRLAA